MVNLMDELDRFVDVYNKGCTYDLDNELILRWYPKRISKKMDVGNVLELGIGHGYSIREFDKIATDHLVLEGSGEVIRSFRERNPDLQYIQIVETLFESYKSENLFDNIIMGFVLEHVEDPTTLIEQYAKFLSPEGRMFIAVPNAESMHRRLGLLAGMLEKLDVLSEFDLKLGHKRYFTLTGLREMVAKSGLSIISEEGLFLKPFTTGQIHKLCLDKKVLEAMMFLGIQYPELSAAILVEVAYG